MKMDSDAKQLTDALLGQLEGRIRSHRAGLLYRFWLLIVAFVLILLPLVYFGLIGGVGYAIFHHATQNTAIIGGDGSSRYGLLLYLIPIVAGAIVLLFMIKPILAKQAGVASSRRLSPEDEPLLFEFVNKLCDVLRAPRPRYIEIDPEVNASASFSGGLRGFLFQRLTLTIGMPLAAGLNMHQFTGVLAHEFGHFAQGGAMRLTFIVRLVNMWFARMVYQRDEWDEKIAELSKERVLRFAVFLWLAQLGIWLTRRVLWVLMWLAHLVSSIMMRQMEFDADSKAARVTGTESFREVEFNLRIIAAAGRKTRRDLNRAFTERRLGDNMPAMIMANLKAMDDELRERIVVNACNEKTGLFDTHPAPMARIRRVEKMAEEGIFHDDRPASVLFGGFEDYCREVTEDQYKAVFGPYLRECKIIPTEDLVGSQRVETGSRHAADRFFFGLLTGLRNFGFNPELLHAPSDPLHTLRKLVRTRETFMDSMGRVRESFMNYNEAFQAEIRARAAAMLIENRVPFKAREFGLNRARAEEVERSLRSSHVACQDAEIMMIPFERAMFERLVSALQLLDSDLLRDHMQGSGCMFTQAREMFGVLYLYEGIQPHIRELLELTQGQKYLKSLAHQNWKADWKREVLEARTRKMIGLMEAIHRQFEETRYPFDHGRDNIRVSYYLAEVIPSEDGSFDATIQIADTMLERLYGLYFRCVGVLADIGEKVERAAGLPPLEETDEVAWTETPAAV